MNVTLTPELERFPERRVRTGRYHSASEVMREALRLLEQQEELWALRKAEIRRSISTGYDSLAVGKGIDGERFFRQLAKKEKSRLAASNSEHATSRGADDPLCRLLPTADAVRQGKPETIRSHQNSREQEAAHEAAFWRSKRSNQT